MFTTCYNLILASASPRRRRLLADAGITFVVESADIDEQPLPGEGPEEHVCRLAEEKARAIAGRFPGACVLAADTVVVYRGKIMGKPVDAGDAIKMLQTLCGNTHEVWTGFCILISGKAGPVVRAVRTEVRFVQYDPEMVGAYVATGEPLDKAGAYGIQGRGGIFVRELKGSCSNVVGLPMADVVQELRRLGVIRPLHG